MCLKICHSYKNPFELFSVGQIKQERTHRKKGAESIMPEAQSNSYTSDSILSDEERQHRIEELRKMIEGNYYAAF